MIVVGIMSEVSVVKAEAALSFCSKPRTGVKESMPDRVGEVCIAGELMLKRDNDGVACFEEQRGDSDEME